MLSSIRALFKWVKSDCSLPIVFALAIVAISMLGLAMSAQEPLQPLREIDLKMPWAQRMIEASAVRVEPASNDFGKWFKVLAIGVGARARQFGSNVASDFANRDWHMHQSFPTSELLRTFNWCHNLALATAGAFFAGYAIHALGVMLGPAVLVIGDLGDIFLSWFGGNENE